MDMNGFMKQFYLADKPNGMRHQMSRGKTVYNGGSNSPVDKKFKNLKPAAKKRIKAGGKR